MTGIRGIIAVMLLCFLGCSAKFSTKDRFEGLKDGAVRIYIRVSNDSDYDETDKELNGIMLSRGGERLKLLAAQGIVEKKFAGEAAGSIVYVRCFEEYCEGFIDYKIGKEDKK